MADGTGLVFLLDVDNTLLDNDSVKDGLNRGMSEFLTPEQARRFWEIYEQVRVEEGVVEFRPTLDRFAAEAGDEMTMARLNHVLFDFPFAQCLFPGALETVRYLAALGTVAVVSDGDDLFQPRKIERSGIAAAVGGRVFIYSHKEQSIAEVLERIPARRYVMVDDKHRILSALKEQRPTLFTTVHVLQGHYALQDRESRPAPDIEVRSIADLLDFDAARFLAPSQRLTPSG